jgi:hypothetical protein
MASWKATKNKLYSGIKTKIHGGKAYIPFRSPSPATLHRHFLKKSMDETTNVDDYDDKTIATE